MGLLQKLREWQTKKTRGEGSSSKDSNEIVDDETPRVDPSKRGPRYRVVSVALKPVLFVASLSPAALVLFIVAGTASLGLTAYLVVVRPSQIPPADPPDTIGITPPAQGSPPVTATGDEPLSPTAIVGLPDDWEVATIEGKPGVRGPIKCGKDYAFGVNLGGQFSEATVTFGKLTPSNLRVQLGFYADSDIITAFQLFSPSSSRYTFGVPVEQAETFTITVSSQDCNILRDRTATLFFSDIRFAK